jgi:glycerate 2-kinase
VTGSKRAGAVRADAEACLLAAIRAVDPARLVREYLQRTEISGGPVVLASIGKAAGSMAEGAWQVLGDRLGSGVVIAPDGVEVTPFPGIAVFRGGHPAPNEEGVRGAESVMRLASALGGEDFLLCLISGGGSALMTLPPPGVALEEVRRTSDLLLRAGATIQELNCVRKHLDRLKGGRLARAAAPARVLALVLSDVIGDPLDVIASGPLSPDPTTYEAAIHVLKRRNVWGALPEAVRDHLHRGAAGEEDETPTAGDPCFERVEVRVVGNNRIAAEAARHEAERRGYRTALLSTSVSGEAREVGRVLAALAREMRRSDQPVPVPGCLVAAGETTVTVTGDGRGGRNQELALGAALEIAGEVGIAIGSVGTDGIDGPTDAAGAICDGTTLERAREKSLDPLRALARNDVYPLLRDVGDLIVTGPTGTNVMDVQVVLVAGP